MSALTLICVSILYYKGWTNAKTFSAVQSKYAAHAMSVLIPASTFLSEFHNCTWGEENTNSFILFGVYPWEWHLGIYPRAMEDTGTKSPTLNAIQCFVTVDGARCNVYAHKKHLYFYMFLFCIYDFKDCSYYLCQTLWLTVACLLWPQSLFMKFWF